MEKVLIISYRFPPADETGTQRTWALAKYLKEFGYYPVIITRNWDVPLKKYEDVFIPTGDTIKHSVYRDYEVYTLPHKDILKNKLNRKYRNRFSLFKKMYNFLDYICMYGHYFGLNEFNAFVRQSEEVLAKNTDIKKAIVITDPYPLFYVGYRLNKEYGVNWIADYRDDWNTREFSDTYGFKKSYLHKLIDSITNKLEKKWVKTASYVTSVSDAYTNRIADFVGVQGKTIYNGYFEEEYVNLATDATNIEYDKTFTIVHNGTLYPLQDIDTFLIAFKELCDLYRSRIRLVVKFIGVRYKIGSEERISKLMSGYEMNYVCTDRISKDKLIKEINNSQLALLISFGKNYKGVATSKIFDYLALNKLTISYPRDYDVVDDLLTSTGLGIISDSKEEIIEKLGVKIEEYLNTNTLQISPNRVAVERYSRRMQTSEVAKLLDQI